MRSVNEVVLIVLNTIFSKAVLQPLGKGINLFLGLLKRMVIFMAALLAFLRLDEAIGRGETMVPQIVSLGPLAPECERLVGG